MAVTTTAAIMTGVQIAQLLEKMNSPDKDFRFMATNDLMAELQKESLKLDEDLEKKIVKMILKLLEDNNGEVQNLAVSCLGPLVGKVKDFQVEVIVDHLCANMTGGQAQLRDVASLSLKTVLGGLPASRRALAATACKTMVGPLSAAVAQQADEAVQLEALDILADLLSRFGGLLAQFYATLVAALLPQLKSQRLAVRKRSISALGNLMMSCDEALYTSVIDTLLKELEAAAGAASGTKQQPPPDLLDARTFVQAVGTVCKLAGPRFGDHVARAMPLVTALAKVDGDDELREQCLQTCESIIIKCGKEVTPYIQTIGELCLEYISFDPNYNYGDNDDDMESMELDEESEDESDGGVFSDDEDMSWKVRRAAAKCLEAVLATRRELLPQFYAAVSPVLIDRFKEREESVKADVFRAYIALLRQTKTDVAAKSLDPAKQSRRLAQLQAQVPSLVKAVRRQMREPSVKTREGCFALLTELISVLPGALADHVGDVVPGIKFSLSEKQSSSNTKIEALAFLWRLLENGEQPASAFHPHADVLVPMVANAVADTHYRTSSEALLVLESLVKVLRPLGSPNVEQGCCPELKQYVDMIYDCCVQRLRTSDVDQEVKERAISCAGRVVANLGDLLQDNKLPECLSLLKNRLENEFTSVAAVKALTAIANSKLGVDLQPILADSLPVLGNFLRKNQRPLRVSTLTLLNSLVNHPASGLNVQNLQPVLSELPSLLSDDDLHVAQLTMHVLASLARLQPETLPAVAATSLPEVLRLAQSPLLQGSALVAMADLFVALAASNAPDLSHNKLIEALVTPVLSANGEMIHKQGQASIAKCVSAIVATESKAEIDAAVKQFCDYLSVVPNGAGGNTGAAHQTIFALRLIGEIGSNTDLSQTNEPMNSIMANLSHPDEEVKTAASLALGHLSLGNLEKFLPFVLSEIEKQPNRRYLLLQALKEIISAESRSCEGVASLRPHLPSICGQLSRLCDCAEEEEGTRNAVAECLGRLCLVEPKGILTDLRKALGSPSALVRSAAVNAVKFAVSHQSQAIDALLKDCMWDFLIKVADPDLNVRRKALDLLNSAAHNKPSLVRYQLGMIMSHVYNETKVRQNLIRDVEMGPFKHRVDDGLDVRKAAFECLYTLLDTCLDNIDVVQFLGSVQDGLKDHYDIQMLTYLMLAQVSQLRPCAVLACLDQLIAPLRATLKAVPKANVVQQEVEKLEELKRAAMRAVTALAKVTGADKHPEMIAFLAEIKTSTDLAKMFESFQVDAAQEAGSTLVASSTVASFTADGNEMELN